MTVTAGKLPKSAYSARRKLLVSRGQWQRWTPAPPVRDHVRSVLAATGLTRAEYAALAGLNQVTITRVLDKPPRDPDVIYMPTATAILAVTATAVPADRFLIDATGSRRRLQALACLGWPVSSLTARSGLGFATLQRIRSGHQALIERGTAAKVTAVYDELWLTPAPEETRGQVFSAAKARLHAARQRPEWVSGAAWDDIDAPACKPKGARRAPAA
jgi:hypothetical protein